MIVDGDTIDIGSTRIRLHGIDAPEAGQKCNEDGGGNWPCGNEAIKAITGITAGKQVTCHGSGFDDYGRTLAVCSVGSVEINREMVKRGLAWNFDKYSMDYKPDEEQARQAHTGVFQADTATPWDYRAERWNFALQQVPNGCPIKGNINSKGEKIYHAPWSPWYKRTKVSLDQGEHWFCDEGEAIKAGWRAPYWN